jgi:hypothetical protein
MIGFSVLSTPAFRCPSSRTLRGTSTQLMAEAALSSPIRPTQRGQAPTLEDYFFKQVSPIVEKIIAENKRSQWPLIVLHFDFKDNQTPLLEAVWNVLGQHEDWLSTAVKTSDSAKLSPIDRKPILVVTEEADEQKKDLLRRSADRSPSASFWFGAQSRRTRERDEGPDGALGGHC